MTSALAFFSLPQGYSGNNSDDHGHMHHQQHQQPHQQHQYNHPQYVPHQHQPPHQQMQQPQVTITIDRSLGLLSAAAPPFFVPETNLEAVSSATG